jgi:NhaA family Na+:H+ antiporter
MATDIAFAVGVLTLLGKRVPPAMRVLLLALAVIDDLGAILVIALFYSDGLSGVGFLLAGFGFGAIYVMQGFGIRTKIAYIAPSIVVWAGVYIAGIHPTIAGVAIGLITPVRVWLEAPIDHAYREAKSPSDSLIHTLHPWVAFGIMPLFALANAGVALEGLQMEGATLQTLLGASIGLVVGKPLGICLATLLAVKWGFGKLSSGLSFRHVLIVGIVAGIGFTMSIFISQLAFTAPALLSSAKMGVLIGSGVAGVFAMILGPILLAAPVEEKR